MGIVRLVELGHYRDAHTKMHEAIGAARVDRRHEDGSSSAPPGYFQQIDPAAALQMQRSALTDTKAVLRPRDGIAYHRLSSTATRSGKPSST